LQPGPAQQAMQNGLGLIVRCVSGGNQAGSNFPCHLPQPVVAQPPGNAFQVGFLRLGLSGHVGITYTKLYLWICSEQVTVNLPDELGISITFRPA
jgi:hypothetical protein